MKKRLFSVAVFLTALLLLCSACQAKESKSAKKSFECELFFVPEDDATAGDDEMEKVKVVLEQRLLQLHITDFSVETNAERNTVTVGYNTGDETTANQTEVAGALTVPSNLAFRPGNSYQTVTMDKNGNQVFKTPANETAATVLLDGADVDRAEAKYGQFNAGDEAEHYVELRFTADGTKKFAQVTKEYQNRVLSIWVNDIMVSAPVVNNTITDGVAIISGNFTEESASDLANQINTGTLPFALKQK